jgi:hypothetical protein
MFHHPMVNDYDSDDPMDEDDDDMDDYLETLTRAQQKAPKLKIKIRSVSLPGRRGCLQNAPRGTS